MRFFTGSDDPDFISDPEGKRSSDCRLLVKPFMDRYFGGYQEEFVCLSIREDDETANLSDAYGFQFELKPDVIDEMAIVCAGDFQNVIYGAYCQLLRGEEISESLSCFEIIPRSATRSGRIQILKNALTMAKQMGRPYAEARMYRSLRRSDCIDPDAGKQESLASLLLNDDE